MMHCQTRHCFPLLLSALLAVMLTAAVSGSLLAQTPNSCNVSGAMSYAATANYNSTTKQTTFSFTFYNNTPIYVDPPGRLLYASIGEIYIYGLPDAISTTHPSDWGFSQVGNKNFWFAEPTPPAPWWYPPSIPPPGTLGGFTYVVSGNWSVQDITAVVDKYQGVDPSDTTWKTPGWGGGYDCATEKPAPTLSVDITKTPDTDKAKAGDTVTYEYLVCNTSGVTLTVTSILDDNPDIGSLLDEFYTANGNNYDIAVQTCVSFKATYTVKDTDSNPLENCVTVVAEYNGGQTQDKTCASVQIEGQPLCINVTKSVTPTEVVAGDTVTYHYKVCNCGSVPVTVTKLTDSNSDIGDLLDEFYTANGDSYDLAKDECVEFTVNYKIYTAGTIENCVDVTAEQGSNSVSDSDCASVDVEEANPGLDVTKTVTPTTVGVGQQATYHYRLCNTGNVPLEIKQFSDTIPTIGDLQDEFYAANGNSDVLAVDGCVEFTVPYTAQEADVPLLENCVTVRGIYPPHCTQCMVISDTDTDCAELTVTEEPVNTRQCFVPVTFTAQGWSDFCNPENGLIPGGMVYNRFPIAFSCYRFFGEEFPNQLVLANNVRLTFTGKTACLENLCRLLGSGCGGCSPLKVSIDCPAELNAETGGGCLAVETIALLMNIAYNDMRLMPKTPGVDLECYTLNQGPLEGKTVGQVLFIANEVLAGAPPQRFGLIDCAQLLEILEAINANYEFVDFFTSNDQGYLTPNKPFGQPEPPHCPELKNFSSDCVIGPCIEVTKTANPAIARVGDTVTYKFKVCNCGPEALTGVVATDTLLGDLTPLFVAANGGSADLAVGKCVEFSTSAVVPVTTAKAISNTVTVTGSGASADAADTDTAVVGILQDNPARQCFLPTTFTTPGWARFCDPNNGVIQGGMIYNRFPQAFKCFEFYGKLRPNELLVGSERISIRYIGKTACLERLCMLLGGDCAGCGKLRIPVDCPWRLTNSEGGGCLAVETITLLLNVAYNDTRLMPRTKGVDLECYRIASGPLKGKTVAQVFNIANELLAGKPPCVFGLASCEQLVAILRQINANYEFVDFNTFNDRGFLIPNAPFNPFCEAHCTSVPMECEIYVTGRR